MALTVIYSLSKVPRAVSARPNHGISRVLSTELRSSGTNI